MFTSTIPTNPNQSFTDSVNGENFLFTTMLHNGITYFSIRVGDMNLSSSVKACPNCFLLNRSLESEYGNFVMYCEDGKYNYPTYENFNGGSVLYYFSPEEMSELREKYEEERVIGNLGNYIGGV